VTEEKLLRPEGKELQVYVKFNEFEEDIRGSPDDVLRALMAFLDRVYPGLEVLGRIRLTVDLHGLTEQIKDIVAVTSSGPVILSRKKLTIRELVGLNLIGAFVGYKLNLMDRDALNLDDLVNLTGKGKGSVSGALTHMVGNRWVEKPERGGYRISALGIKQFQEEVFPKLKEAK